MKLCVEEWRQIGRFEYLCRNIRFGVYDDPVLPFFDGGGRELGDIPQMKEDVELGLDDFARGARRLFIEI